MDQQQQQQRKLRALDRLHVSFAGMMLDVLFDAIDADFEPPVRLNALLEMIDDARGNPSAPIAARAVHLGKFVRSAARFIEEVRPTRYMPPGLAALRRMGGEETALALLAVCSDPDGPQGPGVNPLEAWGFRVYAVEDVVRGATIWISRRGPSGYAPPPEGVQDRTAAAALLARTMGEFAAARRRTAEQAQAAGD